MSGARRAKLRWDAAAAFLMLVPLFSLFGHAWLAGMESYVPSDPDLVKDWNKSDIEITVGTVAHNARALVTRPWAIFDAEACYPASKTLAIGDPMIALSVLGVPVQLVSGDPVATFNFALGAVTWLAGFALYLLVRSWGGLPAAGIAAGLMYAFCSNRVWNTEHPYVVDTAWTVLALLFAERLFRRGRWRDAIGLGIACGMQMAESFYPFFAAICIAIPFGGWLLYQHRLGPNRGPMIGAVVLIGLFAALIFAPYLGTVGGKSVETRFFLPIEELRLGRLATTFSFVLTGAALVLPRRLVFGEGEVSGDPRWVLLATLPLVASIVCLPDVYTALASFVPGLSVIRAPEMIWTGAKLVLFVLAGLGATALLRMVPRRWLLAASIALIAGVYVDTLRPQFLGLKLLAFDGKPLKFEPRRVRPDEETLGFYRRLEVLGNEGPILEHPMWMRDVGYCLKTAPREVLTAAYHHRRTSACAMSFIPPVIADVADVSRRLPGRTAVEEAEALGFTTIVIRRNRRGLPGLYDLSWRQFKRDASRPGTPLRLIHETRYLAAYEIVPSSSKTRRPRAPERDRSE